MALMVVLSTFIFLKAIQFRKVGFVYWALSSFILALTFRIADPWRWLPMGTHFLWHIFGVLASALMFQFIFETDKIPVYGIGKEIEKCPENELGRFPNK